MKVKTSITLSDTLLKTLDEVAQDFKNRSEVIEQALALFFQKRMQQIRDQKDLQIFQQKAKSLNQEAEDVLSYQGDL